MNEWTRGSWVLRLLVALGPLVALLASGAGGAPPPVWLVVAVTGLGLGAAVRPESPLGAGAFLLVLARWALGPEQPGPPLAALLAAAGLLVAHVAAVLVSYGPDRLPVDRALLRRWVVRGAGALALAPVAWGLARAVEGRPAPAGVWVAALVAVSVAAARGRGDAARRPGRAGSRAGGRSWLTPRSTSRRCSASSSRSRRAG